MAGINFPSNPSVGQQYAFRGRVYKYNGGSWEIASGALPVVQAGTTPQVSLSGAEKLENKTVVNPAGVVAVLADATLVQWDLNAASSAMLTLSRIDSARKMAPPQNMKPGAVYVLVVAQGVNGNEKLGFDTAAYTMVGDSTPAAPANSRTIYYFACDGSRMYGAALARDSVSPLPSASPSPAPAPAPTPAPAPSGTESDIASLYSAGQNGSWWSAADTTTFKGADYVTPSGTNTGVGQWNDKSGNGNYAREPVSTNEPIWQLDANGFNDLHIYDPMDVPGGGGATAGFFFGIRAKSTAWLYNTRTIFSDCTSETNGYRVRVNANNNLEFSVGNGSARTTVIATDATILDSGIFTMMAWDDGVKLNVQVGTGAVFSTNRPTSVAAGSASWTFCGDPGVAYPLFEGDIYGVVYRANSAPSTTARDSIRTYLNSLSSSASSAPAPAPAPAPAVSVAYVANPRSGTGYAFGSRKDGAYPYGILPTDVVNNRASVDAFLQNQYNAWKAHSVVNVPNIAGAKAVRFGTDATFLCVSEGMGYGMLLAAIFNDQVTFDGLLNAVRARPCYGITVLNDTNAALGAYLMDWRLYTDGSSGGEGWPAMDGDLDIAMALMLADRQWGASGTTWNYAQQAAGTIAALKAWEFKADGTSKGLKLVDVSRTSDYMFGHFRAFERHMGDTFWSTNATANAVSRAYWLVDHIQTKYSSSAGLVCDFIVATNTADPYPSPGKMGDGNMNEDKYWWNACRNPWRYATDYLKSGDSRIKTITDRISTFFHNEVNAAGGDVTAIGTGYTLGGTQVTGGDSPAYHAPIMVGMMLNPGGSAGLASDKTFLDNLWAWNKANMTTGYYDGEIQLLSMVVASGNWWNP